VFVVDGREGYGGKKKKRGKGREADKGWRYNGALRKYLVSAVVT